MTSDKPDDITATARWIITDIQGVTLTTNETTVTIPARSSQLVETVDVSAQVKSNGARDLLIWLELEIDGQIVSSNLVMMSRPKHFYLIPPTISQTIDSDGDTHHVTLRSNVPALYVWLDKVDARFSDNFFHLQAGKPYTVTMAFTNNKSPKTKNIIIVG